MRRCAFFVVFAWAAVCAGCASPNEESWIGSGVDAVIRTERPESPAPEGD